ncbi:MAG: hypothetical protein U1F36_14205 [Planctomycetota bacterium]
MFVRLGVVLVSLLLPTSLAMRAQDTSALLGRWIGISEDNRGDVLIVEKDALVLEGDRIPYKPHGPNTIVLGGDDGDRAEWSIEGDVLTFTIEGEPAKYRREAKAKTGGNPLAGRGKKTESDPFARVFEGDGLKLELSGAADKGYTGSLTVDGKPYRVEARAKDSTLDGSFEVGGDRYSFTATLDGDQLTLQSDGTTYHLVGQARAGNAEGGAEDAAAPPALDGVFDGTTKTFTHPRGWFDCEFPEGWSVYSQDDAGMIVNPGLTQNDSLDAIVFMLWGRLEQADQNQPVATVIEKYLPRMKQALAQQGLRAGEPKTAVATFRSKEVPGAVIALPATTQQGQQVTVWWGAVVKQDGWLGVGAVVLDAKAEAYLPKVKRIFTTLAPKPPKRNPQLEQALIGRSFSSSQYGRVTKSAHHASYTFAAGGVVTRRLMSNVISEPDNPGISADSERSGRYEVCGDVLFMYFETGQETAQVVQQGGAVSGIRMGDAVYQ